MAISNSKTFKDLDPSDIKAVTTQLSQLVDIVQQDVSGSSTRKQYAVFVTASSDSSVNYAVTSSLFQTVYDQDYTLQVANGLFDMTVGLYWSGSTVVSSSTGTDSRGKMLFSSSSLMMREKVDMYKMFAGKLLGNSEASFYSPYNDSTTANRIDEAMFISFKRLFTRDSIKRNTFAMRFYTSGVFSGGPEGVSVTNGYTGSNLGITSPSGSAIFTDSTQASNYFDSIGGKVGSIVDSSNTNNSVGLLWYDAGIAVLDLKKICYADQHMSGVISAVTGSTTPSLTNQTIIGSSSFAGSNPNAKLIPDLMVSSSMDNLINYFASTRFSSGSLTSMTFQNQTSVNSTLFFCRATADEFNYSNNPTYFDESGNLVVMTAQEAAGISAARPFTYPTTVGLYDDQNRLLAVAKFSRPIEKNDEKDLTVRVRLDF
jgi:hypothetical protein